MEAAIKLFGMLPENQSQEFMGLWEEFEGNQTPEARFSNILDRLQPAVLNLNAGGKAWMENHISYSQVVKKNTKMLNAPEPIKEYYSELLRQAVDKGYLE